ncbi:hypothetical protein A3H40_02515 [Candidatus Daviesbacteria bacterium RIFCSPLOWO2_02_FULL_38_15]|uniref:Uncharacterized protein n=1 Tax=Candidatus Daviesbacteria bacterium RIFCSPLOWO2_02_FULL_38_15 TaxID=1797794 RepID=A0A1F5N3L1_9BACT|nr:MAG: hypothetical protein A3H40_02515 [Candidatus Daviesbacteria bacterium RIFCSPLOWO2_02_FULL_38_15]
MSKKILIALIVIVIIRVLMFINLNIRELTNEYITPAEFGIGGNPVPIWLTDEQRREHGLNYDNLEVLLMHNKVVNYSLSYLSHYLDYFRGDFLFTNGSFLYLFDALFAGVGLWIIIKSPKGWEAILIWLLAAPLIPALDFQPPNVLKAINMYLPLTIISSFGAIKLINLIFRLANRVK